MNLVHVEVVKNIKDVTVYNYEIKKAARGRMES